MYGISDFAKEFRGTIISETMLVDGINYGDEFEKMAEFLKKPKILAGHATKLWINQIGSLSKHAPG